MNTIEILLQHLTEREFCAAGIVLTLILLISIWLIQLICFVCEKLFHKEWPSWLVIILTLLCAAGLFAEAGHEYLNYNAAALDEAKDALVSSEAVIVHEIDEGYLFDGWGENRAVIFYGEERVDETAYAPLLNMVASQGVDCFLVKMPFSRAYLHEDAAMEIRNTYHYSRWYMAAHGNGCDTAVKVLNRYPDDFAGLIALGAFPKEKLDDSLLYIGIYGEYDNLLDTEAYQSIQKDLPKNRREATITGGNHSGFADCGLLTYDKEAKISSPLQQMLSAQMVRLALIGLE